MADCSECNEGGYDYEFVDTLPDTLVCKICHHPSREPYLSLCCGHTFCNSCLKECPCRPTICQYCRIEGEHQFIEGTHKQQCYKFPIPCPNKCKIEKVPSEHLKEHMKVCPMEIVQCQYHNVGCEAKMARKDLVKHDEEKTNEHLLLMKSTLIDTQSKLADTQGQLVDAEQKLAAAEKQIKTNHIEVLSKVEKEAVFQSSLFDIFVQNRMSALEATLKEKAKLIDMLFGEWAIEIHTQAAKLSFCDQLLPVIVKVPDVMKNTSNKSDWDSAPFYTVQNSVKCCSGWSWFR